MLFFFFFGGGGCLTHELIEIALEFVPTLLATQVSIGLDNGLVPTMRLAIIWTMVAKFIDAYMRHAVPTR